MKSVIVKRVGDWPVKVGDEVRRVAPRRNYAQALCCSSSVELGSARAIRPPAPNIATASPYTSQD